VIARNDRPSYCACLALSHHEPWRIVSPLTDRFVALDVHDVRFPTSDDLDGSDAMNPNPDYSAAYAVLRTDAGDGLEGYALAFTTGPGNDLQIRWQHLAWLEPEELVSLVDFRYLTDALTQGEALAILARAQLGRAEREERLLSEGYPAYTTTPGWLGYSDDKLDRLAREAVEQGFTLIKLKVGADVADDVRRMKVARAAVGDGIRIAVDANQRWDVGPAIGWMRALALYDPYWIEEPTSPDDVLGHAVIRRAIHPIKVATGEHVANRVMFKQLLQAGAVDIVQVDAARVAGVNENLAILLLAAKHGIPVCPHAGRVGLCEMVQHVSMFDYVAVSGNWEDRVIEHVDHLHEHFVTPVRLERGRYRAPLTPGGSGQMLAASVAEYSYPDGPVWAARRR
jgi:L-fuconate dehydratase